MPGDHCSKMYPPRLQNPYPRERLHLLLDGCLERPLVWISAPGGAGKSTLVAHYLELRKMPTIWYRVDGRDADGMALFHSLGQLVTAADLSLPTLCDGKIDFFGAREWFREFFRSVPACTVMVFDELHAVDAASEFQLFLACCLEELPAANRVIVTSRDPVPPSLDGFRSRGGLTNLTWEELRVTPQEALGIAGTLPGAEVDELFVRNLLSRTDGWMAGLLLCLRHGLPPTDLLNPPASPSPGPKSSSRRLTVHTLGRFELACNGVPLTFSGKVPKKPLEMLKILLSHGGRTVTTGHFIEALWPDATGAAAMDSLTTTLRRLRQLLGSEKVIRLQQGEVELDRQQVWVDAWLFEELLIKARDSHARGDESHADTLKRQALLLYQGHFLPGDVDKSWSFACRERLRVKFTHHAGLLCRRLDEQGETRQAIACYREGLEIDHLSEEFYQQLILCCHQEGLHAEAAAAYERCRKNLALNLGIAPSPRTEEIYRMITNPEKS